MDLVNSDIIEELTPEQLDVVLRLVRKKLPPVLETLDKVGSGWKQTMTLASYLLAATFNRHPELIPDHMALMVTLESAYPKVEAAFAAQAPGTVSDLITRDIAFFVLPEEQEGTSDNKEQHGI